MTTHDLFAFRKSTPPSLGQFREIGAVFLADQFRDRFARDLVITSEHIEPRSWVHRGIFFGDGVHHVGACHLGIIIYTVARPEAGMPRAESVLLQFENGRRVANGRDTILTAGFTPSGWEDFTWAKDGYREWECEHLHEAIPLPA